jgi:hypothetical protein
MSPRSLASTLSHRFPINIHGDPHASPAMHPFVHSIYSVVSVLSLSQFAALAPLEHIQLQGEYLKYLNATHITPLRIIQALLPLMRNAIKNGKGKKSIVVCSGGRRAHRAALPGLGSPEMVWTAWMAWMVHMMRSFLFFLFLFFFSLQ